jgi:predicted methyltransferase
METPKTLKCPKCKGKGPKLQSFNELKNHFKLAHPELDTFKCIRGAYDKNNSEKMKNKYLEKQRNP